MSSSTFLSSSLSLVFVLLFIKIGDTLHRRSPSIDSDSHRRRSTSRPRNIDDGNSAQVVKVNDTSHALELCVQRKSISLYDFRYHSSHTTTIVSCVDTSMLISHVLCSRPFILCPTIQTKSTVPIGFRPITARLRKDIRHDCHCDSKEAMDQTRRLADNAYKRDQIGPCSR